MLPRACTSTYRLFCCAAGHCLVAFVCWLFPRPLGKWAQWEYFLCLTDKGTEKLGNGSKLCSKQGPTRTDPELQAQLQGAFLQYFPGAWFVLAWSSFQTLKSSSSNLSNPIVNAQLPTCLGWAEAPRPQHCVIS